VLPGRFMIGVADIALAIASFVTLEVVESLGAAAWKRAIVAMMGVKAVIDMAVEAGVPVEPGSGADEEPTFKPVGAVVAIGSTVVGRVVKVAVGANGGHSNVDPDLGGSCGWSAQEGDCER